MGTISTAVGLERRSRVAGYRIKKGFFDNDPSNLPHVIVVLGEANTANQAGLSLVKKEVTSAHEAGELYGHGSPIHQIMRILRPESGDGVGGIPTVVIPQRTDVAATATTLEVEISGNATANATHYLRINGRESLDFKEYAVNIVAGDTPAIIYAKIADSINNVLSCPVTAAATASEVTLTTKWKGLTSAELRLSFNLNGAPAGLTYAIATRVDGAGDVSLDDAFDQFGTNWYTDVVHCYQSKLGQLEAFNGVPYVNNPTGRYNAIEFKPFIAFFGSVLDDKDDLVAITDDSQRVAQVTNVLCPAPKSEGFTWEAAANVCLLFSRTMQDTPEIDVNNMSYPDMPIPIDEVIGDMSDYNNRDFLIKKGCSTVILENGAYVIQDLVTTYHPEGENPLQFNYCRNINLDWNICDAYRISETRYLKDKVLIRDKQITDSANAIKPKEWKAIVYDLFDDWARMALINDPDWSKSSVKVQISTTNPNRFETFFRYRRTGIARIESTDVEAGF